jgi:competence protein ComGC
MAGNREMQENERNVFGLHGVVGMLIATLLLISILIGLSIASLTIQANEATNVYKLESTQLNMIDESNKDHYQLVK